MKSISPCARYAGEPSPPAPIPQAGEGSNCGTLPHQWGRGKPAMFLSSSLLVVESRAPLAHLWERGWGRGLLLLCLLLLASLSVQAFDLTDLQQHMQQSPVVRGDFVQEKHIRGLAQPLISQGRFTLAAGKGLLWRLKAPIQRNLRITEAGVAHNTGSQWRLEPAQKNRQTQLFLAVLRGDSAELQKQFELALSGDEQHWQLTLTPKSALLRQIFTRIQISGGALVSTIELIETSGERTVIKLLEALPDSTLTAEEAKDFEG